MPFRAPRNFWEWVLLFSPALVIWVATAIAFVLPAPGFEWRIYFPFIGTLCGSFMALWLCVFAGRTLTDACLEGRTRRTRISFVAVLIALLNFTIAFAGCAVAGR